MSPRPRIGFQVDHGANPHLWTFPRTSGLPRTYFHSEWRRLVPVMERVFAAAFVVTLAVFLIQGVAQ